MAFICNCLPGTHCVDCPHGCSMPPKDHEHQRLKARDDTNVSHTIYDEEIQKKINPLFVSTVNPETIVHLFHEYNMNVLVQQDIDRVMAITSQYGRMGGAKELLHQLVKYKDWFICLLQVFRDPRVQQDHLADELIKDIDPNRRLMLELC